MGRRLHRRPPEPLPVAGRDPPAAGDLLLEVAQLHAQERGLHLVEPLLVADDEVLVLDAPLAHVAELTDPRIELLVARRDHAPITDAPMTLDG